MVLDGIRVLDLTKVLAGPYGGMVLADLGAEVIKIEAPGQGEDGRNTYPKRDDVLSAFFVAYNLGKKSITLDLKKEEAKQAFYKLVATSDVILENMRTGAAERLGIGYEQLKAIKPDIIYCSISGYGREGPYSKKGGYDIIAQAQFGMMAVTGNGRDGEPVRCAYSVNDVGTGLSAAFAVVCALLHRIQTGEGQRVEATLMHTQMAFAGHMATLFDVTKKDHKCHGMASFQLAPHQGYRTKDGWVIIATSNEKQWENLCTLPEFNALHHDSRFKTMKLRVENRAELTRIFEDVFKDMTAKEVEILIDNMDIPVTKVNNMRDIYANKFFKSATMDDIPFEGHGTLAIPKTPMLFEKLHPAGRRAAPYLGEDNTEVFSQLGYSETEIEKICN